MSVCAFRLLSLPKKTSLNEENKTSLCIVVNKPITPKKEKKKKTARQFEKINWKIGTSLTMCHMVVVHVMTPTEHIYLWLDSSIYREREERSKCSCMWRHFHSRKICDFHSIWANQFKENLCVFFFCIYKTLTLFLCSSTIIEASNRIIHL